MVHDAVFLRNIHPFQPVGETARHALLPEALLFDTTRIPLHRHRPPDDVRQHDRRDRFVVGRQLALGDRRFVPHRREHDLVRMCDHPFTPSKREWRSLRFPVHSMNATRTTISGLTQCALRRGSPVALVNGDLGISIALSRARRSSSSFVSKPVPTFPANTKSSPSNKPTSSAPKPTRPPCGSVKPPTTRSQVSSHFILSHSFDRLCSYGESRRLATTPSH